LIRRLEKGGDLPRAIDYARRAVAADPLREGAHHELIRLLSAAGQAHAARQQYRELERLLARHLGEAPADATRELVLRIERESGKVHHGAGDGVPKQWADLGREADSGGGRGPGETRRESGEDGEQAIQARLTRTRTVVSSPSHAAEPLPTGTLTFLLVELESTAGTEAAPEVLSSLFRGYGGREVQVTAGRVVMAFGRASEALAAAVAGMQHLLRASYSVSERQMPAMQHATPNTQYEIRNTPRMALDTGEVAPGDPPQHSPAVEHASRLLLAAHPGQILLSEKSAALLRHGLAAGVRLADRGRFYLRTGAAPEHLFQVEGPGDLSREFPPPKAAPVHAGTLPLQLTRFFGREAELARLRGLLLEERRRLVTLTGPGGGGKTRLALDLA
jgi:hypothetical protein